MKERVNENRKENKKYKTTILKIYNETYRIKYSIDEIKTVKIISYDIMKSIDNLEYLESERLNEHLPEDELLFRYGKEIKIDDYENFIKSDDYKRVTKYLKDNIINKTLIDRHISIIYDYLKSNNKINLETLKKAILNNEDIKHSHINHSILIEREKTRKSGETFQINETGDINYNQLRCVIKMTEYTPISGGNMSELNTRFIYKQKEFISIKK